MPEFPKTEAEIQALGETLLNALENDFVGLQGSAITAAEFALILDGFKSKSFEAMQAKARANQLTKEKRAGKTVLKQAMRQLLRFAEGKKLSAGELERIGWGERRVRRAAAQPGQPLGLTIVKEGSDWISLRWKADRTGGKAKFYRIMRRIAGGEFHEVASALGTEHNLIEQPRGVQLELYVAAVNNAGMSVPSNAVFAVL